MEIMRLNRYLLLIMPFFTPIISNRVSRNRFENVPTRKISRRYAHFATLRREIRELKRKLNVMTRKLNVSTVKIGRNPTYPTKNSTVNRGKSSYRRKIDFVISLKRYFDTFQKGVVGDEKPDGKSKNPA